MSFKERLLKFLDKFMCGCTMVPDFNFCDCCNEHDVDYVIGGTEADRIKADRKLELQEKA